MMFSSELNEAARALLGAMQAQSLQIATAESCTGGLIAALLTEVPGSSAVVDRGFVTYSNDAKHQMLGVPTRLLADHGAVSREVAMAMAEGALAHASADVSVAVTGVAGPGGGSPEKPVGLVHIAVARRGTATLHRECRFGNLDRATIRLRTVSTALEMALDIVRASSRT